MLGPIAVEGDEGGDIAIGSPSQRTVLAVLLAAEGRAVTADRLVDALWEDRPPRTAHQSLRTYVSRLRSVLGDRLEGQAGSYRLRTEADEVDARRFEALVDRAGHLAPVPATEVLVEALGLWRGEAFGDVRDTPAVAGTARRLEERRSGARQALAAALVDAGDAAGAVAHAEALVADEPLREGAWVVLVRALLADDRPAEALRAVRRAGTALAEAGLEPSAALRGAEQDALAGEAPSPPPAVGRVEAPGAPRVALVGREGDAAQVHALLDRARVVTIHGPGGVGKTSLARRVLAERASQHRQGGRVVELAPIGDPAAVPLAVADGLGLALDADSAHGALRRAGALDVLVLLDCCEHVLDAVAEVVELLVDGGGGATVLATSRERIGVVEEHSWSLAPLDPSRPDGPAVELFLERARQHGVDLGVEEVRPVIRRIVGHLDGLPLAIEMAAARVPGLGLVDLDAVLADRFDILRATRRRGDHRHRTLTAVVEWSEDLLTPDQRDLLADLSVFAGPVPAADIEAVVDRTHAIDGVSGLVERSLVVADRRTPVPTYGLLEIVRRHARDRLRASGRAEEMSRRHAVHQLDRARRADAALRTEDEGAASAALDGAFAELRIAHEWAVEEDPAVAVGLSAALHVYAASRLRDEALGWAERAAPLLGSGPDASVVLASVAHRANDRGRLDEARAAGEAALAAAAGDPVERFALEELGDTAMYQGDLAGSLVLGRRMLDAAERAQDTRAVALGACAMALALAYAGDRDGGLATLAPLDLSAMGPSSRGWVAYSEGEVLLDHDPTRATAAFGRAIALADGVDDRFLAGVARVSAASLLSRVGAPEEALPAFAATIEHWHRRGDHTHQLTTLRNLVVLLDRVGAPEPAAELLGALEIAPGAPSYGTEAERLDGAAERVEAALGPAFARRRAIGAERDLPAAARAAIAQIEALLA